MSGYSDAELESAVYHDNSSFISSWLRSLTDEERKAETTRAKQAMVLRKASLYHNLGVIKIVLQLSKEIFIGKRNEFVCQYIIYHTSVHPLAYAVGALM